MVPLVCWTINVCSLLLLYLLSCVPSAGLLSAVTNPIPQSLGQVIRLTWDAPFSLDIPGADPDIWYRVNISTANSSLSTDSIIKEVNIPEFNFTTANTSEIFHFQVTSFNGAGDGVTSSPVTGFFIRSELLNVHGI